MSLKVEEKRLLSIFRKYRAEKARQLPAKLLEHGYVSVKEAAKLLRCSAEEIEHRNAERTLPKVAEGIPLSELRKVAREKQLGRLRTILADAERVIRSGTTKVDVLGSISEFMYYARRNDERFFTAHIAKRLGVSKAKVRDLPLFLFEDHLGRVWTTREELEAYERAHPAPQKQRLRAA